MLWHTTGKSSKMNLRIGFGFDAHRLGPGHKMVIGGIEIPWEKGCIGYSDGDVLIHAICDAMLGAASAGDIGMHFPSTSPEFKGIDSKVLLSRTKDIIRLKGFQVNNIDSTICLQKPKLSEYILSMRETLSKVLDLHVRDVSIKTTTTDNMGFVGREEGVSAYATVLLESL
jgi:2-C-methyl-D-erythritol 2,4-cyclodiphosphate synthase